jgi:hypothetical protein
MQPTRQASFPFRFAVGEFGTTRVDISPPSGYDALVTFVAVNGSTAGAAAFVALWDTAGDLLAIALALAPVSSDGANGNFPMGLVVPDGTGLHLSASTASVFASVSGWLVEPGTDTLLSLT